MKKTLIVSASAVVLGCLLTACGGEGGSATTKVEKKDLSTMPKVNPPDQAIKDSLKANTAAPPDAPKKKTPSGG